VVLVAMVATILVAYSLRVHPQATMMPFPTTLPTELSTTDAQILPSLTATVTVSLSTTPTLAPLPFQSAPATLAGGQLVGWALMDQRTGQIWGSATMAATNWTASMIKAWIGADYLHEHAQPSQASMALIETMIRDSDNTAADSLYYDNGEARSIRRMITRCGLTDSAAGDRWARTSMSARDAARLGTCIANGTAAGTRWTNWYLGLMRTVRGEGNFGIRDALPVDQRAMVAIKNGYEHFSDDGLFRVNCLAIGPGWTMAVLQTYRPIDDWDKDLRRGANGCVDIARQLLSH
jgi:hypothetical protein